MPTTELQPVQITRAMNGFIQPDTPNTPKWAAHTSTCSRHHRFFLPCTKECRETLVKFIEASQTRVRPTGRTADRIIQNPYSQQPYLHTPRPHLLLRSVKCGFVLEKQRCFLLNNLLFRRSPALFDVFLLPSKENLYLDSFHEWRVGRLELVLSGISTQCKRPSWTLTTALT
jgi:hypothetical protein